MCVKGEQIRKGKKERKKKKKKVGPSVESQASDHVAKTLPLHYPWSQVN